jgi:L-alanine-DL-glutamate epimerase-like enolase superfamily enzyme
MPPPAQRVIDDVLAGVVVHRDTLAVPAHHEAMVRASCNLGRPGLVSCAISAVDIALWDLKARCLGCSLFDLWGPARPDAPVYGSGGFTTYYDQTATEQLERWVDKDGLPRVKIKIGESRDTWAEWDLARVALARRVVGPAVELYVDANGAYSQKQAVRLGQLMHDEFGVTCFDEPVSSDDLFGLQVVRVCLPVDVAAGEYGYSPVYFSRVPTAGAVDCLPVDVTRCGRFTDWLAIAAMAAAHNLQVSAHCAPNLHAHVGVCVPNLRHVEFFHDHRRIEEHLFDGALSPRDGALCPPRERTGHGMTLRSPDAVPYRTA